MGEDGSGSGCAAARCGAGYCAVFTVDRGHRASEQPQLMTGQCVLETPDEVFSDHGSGAPSREPGAIDPYADLRTANLLAVRSPGHVGIIDDRSTLANLLPRLLRAYTGSGPADVPETIFAWTGNPATSFYFQRPD